MLKIGIVGTGRIAGRFVPEAGLVYGVSAEAVYNPHTESAERFAERFGITACRSPEELYSQVEAVYIASPHGTHYDYIKSALEHGRHVLCEKPMVLRRQQAEELFRYAAERGLVLFEGIKTAYCPGFVKLLSLARSGVIGDIRNVEACFTKLVERGSRELADPECGGSFPELGSYCVLPIVKLFGPACTEVRFDTIENEDGQDIFTRASFCSPGGIATATCGLGVKSDGRLLIAGTKGYLLAEAPWWKTTRFALHYEDPSKVDRCEEEYAGDGLRYELCAFLERVNGEAEKYLSAEESIAIAGLMEQYLEKR